MIITASEKKKAIVQEQADSRIDDLIELYRSSLEKTDDERIAIINEIDSLSMVIEDVESKIICKWFCASAMFNQHKDIASAMILLQDAILLIDDNKEFKNSDYYTQLRFLEVEMAIAFPFEIGITESLIAGIQESFGEYRSYILYLEARLNFNRFDYETALYKIQESLAEYKDNDLIGKATILFQLAQTYIKIKNIVATENTLAQLKLCQAEDITLLENMVCIISARIGYLKNPIEITKYYSEPLEKELDRCSSYLLPQLFDEYYEAMLHETWVGSSFDSNSVLLNIEHFHIKSSSKLNEYLRAKMLGDYHHKRYVAKIFGYHKELYRDTALSHYAEAMEVAVAIDERLKIKSYQQEISLRIENLQLIKPKKKFFLTYVEEFMPVQSEDATTEIQNIASQNTNLETDSGEEKPRKRKSRIIRLDEAIANESLEKSSCETTYSESRRPNTDSDVPSQTGLEIESFETTTNERIAAPSKDQYNANEVPETVCENYDVPTPIHRTSKLFDDANENAGVVLEFEESYSALLQTEEYEIPVISVTTEISLPAPKLNDNDTFDTITNDELATDYYLGRNGQEKDFAKAYHYFSLSADNGSSYAQYALGWMLLYGEGVDADEGKAFDWFKISAAQGQSAAQAELAELYLWSEIIEKNEGEAYMLNKKSARKGNSKAQYNLGRCYEYGYGVDKDWALAFKWYMLSAEQDYTNAQNAVGICYEYGKGVAEDIQETIRWYTKSAESENSRGQYFLANMYEHGKGVEQDLEKAFEWYLKSAEQGDSDAQNGVGRFYENGYSIDVDFEKAVEWYIESAESGNKYGQYNLADMYEYGKGVEKNLEKAFEWYLKSAEQGHSSAQNSVGLAYENGDGIEKDFEKAVEWYTKSAEQGNSAGQYWLADMYKWGKGVEKNLIVAFEWYLKSAEQGDSDAQNEVGSSYENGRGVEKDLQKASEWYRKAAMGSDSDDIENDELTLDVAESEEQEQ